MSHTSYQMDDYVLLLASIITILKRKQQIGLNVAHVYLFCAAEQSSSAGILIQDKMQLGQGGVDIVFGCETKETGEIFNQEADGIMGLGNSEVSIVNQVIRVLTISNCLKEV